MKKFFKNFFLIIIIITMTTSISFSSLSWRYGTDGSAQIKPITYDGLVVVGDENGNVHSISLATKSRVWKTFTSRKINQLTFYENGILVTTSEGKIFKMDKNGKISWSININETVYGLGTNQNYIFVSTENGIYRIEKNGESRTKIINYNKSVATTPAAGRDFAIIGINNQIIKISENGQQLWKNELDAGNKFWISKPLIEGDLLIVGGLDGVLHTYSLNDGREIWKVKTKNWITTTPKINKDVIYFGNAGGNIYAVELNTGNIIWIAKTSLGVNSDIEYGRMGDKEVVFVSTQEKAVYAINKETGEIIWKALTERNGGSPLYTNEVIIFGSEEGVVYAYNTERSCSINSPENAASVGIKEIEVIGNYASKNPNPRARLKINNGEWKETNNSDGNWVGYFDPKKELNPGLNTIICQVADDAGEEQGEILTMAIINYDPNGSPGNLVVKKPTTLMENEPFNLSVFDNDDGSVVNNFIVLVNNKNISGMRTVKLVLPAGSYKATIKKIGFNNAVVSLEVSSKNQPNLPLIIGGFLVFCLLLFAIWKKVLKK